MSVECTLFDSRNCCEERIYDFYVIPNFSCHIFIRAKDEYEAEQLAGELVLSGVAEVDLQYHHEYDDFRIEPSCAYTQEAFANDKWVSSERVYSAEDLNEGGVSNE